MFTEHRGYVTNNHLQKSTGENFNKKDHTLADMQATILGKNDNKEEMVKKERESM